VHLLNSVLLSPLDMGHESCSGSGGHCFTGSWASSAGTRIRHGHLTRCPCRIL